MIRMRKKSDKINNFHFECNNVLTKELGRFDALVQFQEVALLQMLDDQEKSGPEIDEYVSAKALLHHIPLGHVPFSRFKDKIHQSYLIYPFACLDQFLKEWVREMYVFFGKPDDNDKRIGFRIEGKKEESYLDSVLKALEGKGIKLAIPTNYKKILEYYRLSRNAVAHHKEENTEKITAAYAEIDIAQALSLLHAWQEALSQPCQYELDDLVAYSAYVKRFADDLSHLLYEKLDWTQLHPECDDDWVAALKKIRAKYDRQQSLQGYVCQRYGEPIPDNQIEETMRHLNL